MSYRVNRSGSRGPAGTISSLNTLPEKTVVVAADLTITGDSAASFTNKKSTWQQIIDSVLSVFILKTDLNNVTNDAQLKRSANDFTSFDQKTTIVDGDHVLIEDSEDSFIKKWILKSLLAGGGGDPEYEVVGSPVDITGAGEVLFTIGADDVVKFELDNVVMSNGTFIYFSVSSDAGVSFLNIPYVVASYISGAGGPFVSRATSTFVKITQDGFQKDLASGKVTLRGVTTAGKTTVRINSIEGDAGAYVVRGGAIVPAGALNMVKFRPGVGVFDGGTITLLRRTF